MFVDSFVQSFAWRCCYLCGLFLFLLLTAGNLADC